LVEVFSRSRSAYCLRYQSPEYRGRKNLGNVGEYQTTQKNIPEGSHLKRKKRLKNKVVYEEKGKTWVRMYTWLKKTRVQFSIL
jgi:hypothetical protein